MLEKIETEKRLTILNKLPCSIKEAVDKILNLEERCFPLEWQDSNDRNYYSEALRDERNVSVFLANRNVIVGFALFIPLRYYLDEISAEDEGLKLKDENEYYLDTIQILKEFRGVGGLELIIEDALRELKKRGVNHISLHARKLNKFNEKIMKIFHNSIVENRDIEKWGFAGNEPYNFLRIKIA